MDIYTVMRQFADSWALLALFVIFVSVILFVFRPGAGASQQDAASSIFRNETRPAPQDEPKKEAR